MPIISIQTNKYYKNKINSMAIAATNIQGAQVVRLVHIILAQVSKWHKYKLETARGNSAHKQQIAVTE